MARSIYDILLKGQRVLVSGEKSSYRVTDALTKTVFKAHVEDSSTPVVLKSEDHPVLYRREQNVYQFNCIRESPYIRAMRESIDNITDKCLVFEWMDSDLWSLRNFKQPPNSPLLKTVAKSTLNALSAFSDMDGQGPAVHTDVNPNNIMVSGAETRSPIVKLADLGGVIPAGTPRSYRLQGFSIRAPEIWMGHPPSTACDVWSVGVSMAHFIARRALFGIMDQNIRIDSVPLETSQAAWSIGKIIQLLGPLTRKEDAKFSEEFDLAEALVDMGVIKVNSLEDELAKFKTPEGSVEFIRYLLTLAPEERPTARQALEHPWLQGSD